MTGMPLEPQMRACGARPLRPVRTAPLYRLAALPGQPPRPGLWRAAEGGASIAGELWAMPTDRLGAFLCGIPAPLGLGRVRLDDGSETVGFLGEAAACAAATDITVHGGWRAWLAARAGADG
jgi:allophanate hydrolase